MSLPAVGVFVAKFILTAIDGHFELFLLSPKNNYTWSGASVQGAIK
jgi:hypothetical protein